MNTDTIERIYSNEYGISFLWKNRNESEKIQLIFRDTGFHLSKNEIEKFNTNLKISRQQKNCAACSAGRYCRSILLKTPSKKISLAVSLDELDQIEDLFNGTLFHLNLHIYINKICKN